VTEGTGVDEELQKLIGKEVVLDVKDPHLYIGTLKRITPNVVVLTDADVHFCGDSMSTTEFYLLQTKKNGIRPNRREVLVLRSEVVSISLLSSIVEY